MSLPNSLNFTPFDQLTAAELNDMVENDEALQTGAAFDTNTDTSKFGGPYTSGAVTVANFTLGNGVVVSRYKQIGKLLHWYGTITWGSSTSSGGVNTLTLPVAARTGFINHMVIGNGSAIDGANIYPVVAKLASTTQMNLTALTTLSGANPVFMSIADAYRVSSTVPFTWGNGKILTWDVIYEV